MNYCVTFSTLYILNTTYKDPFSHRYQTSRSFLGRIFVLRLLFRLTFHFRLLYARLQFPVHFPCELPSHYAFRFCFILQVGFLWLCPCPSLCALPSPWPTFATCLFPFSLPNLMSFVRVTSSNIFRSSCRSFWTVCTESQAGKAASCRPVLSRAHIPGRTCLTSVQLYWSFWKRAILCLAVRCSFLNYCTCYR